MARAIAAFSALRNIFSKEKNWGLVSNIFFDSQQINPFSSTITITKGF
jgi:hypothetical protein